MRRLSVALLTALAVGWLWLSPSTVQVASSDLVVECRPLGWGSAGELSLIGAHGYPSSSSAAVTEYIAEQRELSADPDTELQMRISLAAGCEQVRENRQTTLIVVLATGLTLLLAVGRRRVERTPPVPRGSAEAQAEAPGTAEIREG